MARAAAFILSVTVAVALVTWAIVPPDGNSIDSVPVAMQTATSGPSIYYTTHDSASSQLSTLHGGAMNLMSSAVVTAKPLNSGSDSRAEAPASFARSQPLLARMANGLTRYADNTLSANCTNGNYSIVKRNCTGSDGNAYISLQSASDASAAGDTVIIRGGGSVYTGPYTHNKISPKNGSSITKRTIYEGYQDEQPIVRGFDAANCAVSCVQARFLYYKNFIVDVGSQANSTGITDTAFSRFENLEVRNAGQNGILGISNSELIDLNIHDNGKNNPNDPAGKVAHGLYTATGPEYINNIIDGGRYHNNGGFGIHCYRDCGPNTAIRNVRVDHNGTGGIIVAFNGSKVVINNVIADNNGTHGIWIAANGTVLERSTAYSNRAYGVCIDSPGVSINYVIALQNSVNIGTNCNSGTYSFAAVESITRGSASTFFADAANGNFQLLPSSKVKGVGADLRQGTTKRTRY